MSSRFCCRRRQYKKEGMKRKEMEGKVHKVTRRYISSICGWADTPGPIPTKSWHACCTSKSKHPIFVITFSGVSDLQGIKIPFSHWLCWSSLQQCCAVALWSLYNNSRFSGPKKPRSPEVRVILFWMLTIDALTHASTTVIEWHTSQTPCPENSSSWILQNWKPIKLVNAAAQ